MSFKYVALIAASLAISNEVNAAAIPFADDFESGSLGNWTQAGRRVGSFSTNVVSRHGSQMAHVRKDGFTEVSLGNRFDFSMDLKFLFDMEVSSYSNAGPTSSAYGFAAAAFNFYDASGNNLGGISYGTASTSYLASVVSTNPTGAFVQVAENVLQSYSLSMVDLMSLVSIPEGDIDQVDFSFIAYSSYNGGGGEVFFDNVHVVPVPAALWLFGAGLLGLFGIARRKT